MDTRNDLCLYFLVCLDCLAMYTECIPVAKLFSHARDHAMAQAE